MNSELKDQVHLELLEYKLSNQQMIISTMILDGHSNAEIAEHLKVRVPTLKNYITALYKLVQVKDRNNFISLFYQKVLRKRMGILPKGLSHGHDSH